MARGITADCASPSVELRARRVAPVTRHRLTTAICLLAVVIVALPAHAQQANGPGYDPRQTEKRFDTLQSDQATSARPRLPLPQFSRPQANADSTPLFVLHHVSVTGAEAIPRDRLATAYQPSIGKKVSQADLV